jgi:hypothetical protein
MPEFDKNLNPFLLNKQEEAPLLPNVAGPKQDFYNPFPQADLSGGKKTNPFFGSGYVGTEMPGTVSAKDLFSNRRYDIYNASIPNMEDAYSYNQGIISKGVNGILKGTNLAGTTIVGGFAALGGAIASPFTGKLSTIWDNPVMNGLDEWNEEVDQVYLPNYYSDKEKNAAWYSPDNWFTANFLFDKLIKNSGYAVGAMLSGNLADLALLRTGAAIGKGASALAATAESSQAFKLFTPILRGTSRAFSAGKNIEAAQVLQQEISSIADIASKSSQLSKIAKEASTFAKFNNAARRTAIAAYSSGGEAAFEALQTSKEYRNKLIEEYRNTFGKDPVGTELENINNRANQVGKSSFLGNLALLSVTEYVQLPYLLGSSYKQSRTAANSILSNVDDVILKDGKYVAKSATEATRFGKLYNRTKKFGTYVFDPKEAGQEIGQYALQIGSQNYFDKANEGSADFLVDGVLYGLFGKTEEGEDVGALVSKEGLESGLLGGITGGLMQTFGKSGKYAQDKQKEKNTSAFISELNNSPSAKEAFIDRMNYVNRGVASQQQYEKSIQTNDKLEALDSKNDLLFSYAMPRIKYGKFDMLVEDLKELSSMAMENGGQGLQELIEQGIGNINDDINTFQARVNSTIKYAEDLRDMYDYINLTYAGEVIKDSEGKPILDPKGNPIRKYSPELLDKMTYAASKVVDYDKRIPNLSATLIGKGISNLQEIINDELSGDAPIKLNEALLEIDNSEIIEKEGVKQDLKDVVELALRRKYYLNELNDIQENPRKYSSEEMFEELTKEGKKKRTTRPDKTDYFSFSREKLKSDKRKYSDLVKQYGEGVQNKQEVLRKIMASPHATILEKQLASKFLEYTDRDAKIVLGDKTLSNPGISKLDPDTGISTSYINYEDMSEDYEGGNIPLEFVLLHEIGHDLTVKGLYEDAQFKNEITELFDFVKKHFENDPTKYSQYGAAIKSGKFYAFKDIYEFVTEAMSNREFQRYLSTIPYKTTQKTAWQDFTDKLKTFFRRLFGINDENALEEAIAIITNNIDRLQGSIKERNKEIQEVEENLNKNKEDIKNEQTQIEVFSGDVPSVDSTDVSVEEGLLKDASILYLSSTTESEQYNDVANSEPHVRRSREFLNNANNFENRNKLRAILVTALNAKALGLEGIVQLSYKVDANRAIEDIENVNDIDTRFVAQVYVTYDKDASGKNKLFFVDKDGQKLTEIGVPADLGKVVFQTMPTASLKYSNGNARHRSDQKEEAEEELVGYKAFREELFKQDPLMQPEVFAFNISRGIKIPTKNNQKNQVGGIIIPENKIQNERGLIEVSTTGEISFKGKNIKVPKGVPVIKYGDNLEILNNKKFNDKQAKVIFKAIEKIANSMVTQSKKKGKISIPRLYSDFLQNILYWKSSEETLSNNQIRINVDTLSINLGENSYSIFDIASKEKDIIENLKNAFFSVNNTSLKDDSFDKPFNEFVLNNEGELETVVWPNYQSYLLSSKNPDGTSRSSEETPLLVSIEKPTENVPYSFQQKYSTLIGLEFPEAKVKIKTEAQPVQETASFKVGKYELNGKTENVYEDKDRLITFTGEVSGGTSSVIVIENDELKKIGSDDALVNKAKEILKDAQQASSDEDFKKIDIASLTGTETIKLFYELVIPLNLNNLIQAQQEEVKESPAPTEPAPAVEEDVVQPMAPPEVVAQQDLEAKKADIERRKKEEISQLDKSNKTFSESEINKASSNEVSILKEVQNSDVIKQAKIDQDLHDAVQDTDRFSEKDKQFLEEDKKLKQRFIDLIEGKNVSEEEINDVIKGLTKDKAIHGQYLKMPENENTGSYTWHNHWISVYNGWLEKLNELKDINAKYDAELAALEGVKPAEEKPAEDKSKVDKNKFKGRGNNKKEYRRVGINDVERMTEEDFEAFKIWAKENVPNIPYETLDRIFKSTDGGKNWGVFEDGVVKFVKGGLRGVEYHEVFEAVWAGFLSEEERNNIIDELRASGDNFVDKVSGKTLNYRTATDNQIKERIADDFSEYRLGKLPARSLTENIRKFFKAIINFFKEVSRRISGKKPSLKDELFKAINTGKYKNEKLSAESSFQGPEYRAVDGMTEQQTHEFVQDMLAISAGILFKQGEKNLLFNPERITSNEMFAEIQDIYENDIVDGISTFDLISEKAWQELKVKVKDELRILGISFNRDSSELEIQEDEVNKNDYIKDTFSTDWKSYSTGPVKFFLATLIQRAQLNQSGKMSLKLPDAKQFNTGYTGGFRLVNFSKAFTTVLNKIGNTFSLKKLEEKLIDLAENDSNYVSLFQRVGGSLENKVFDFSSFEKDDWRLFIQFMTTFSKQKPEALIQYINEGEVYTSSANLSSSVNDIKNSWIENMKTLGKSPNNIILYDRVEKVYTIQSLTPEVEKVSDNLWRVTFPNREIKNYDSLDAAKKAAKDGQIKIGTINDMVNFLSMIGIDFPKSIHRGLSIVQKDEFAKSVNQIKNYIDKNKEVMTLNGKTLGINAALNKLAELYVVATNPTQDPTYYGVQKEKVGSFAEDNFISVFENEFNESETLDELLSKRPELNDVFSTNSEILKRGGMFFNSEGKRIREIKVKYIQGTDDITSGKGKKTSQLTYGKRITQEINQNLNGNYYVLIPADGETEWMMNLGNTISFKDIYSSQGYPSSVFNVFEKYLLDEVQLALDYKRRSKIDNVKPRAKELRFFKEILLSDTVKDIEEMISSGSTFEEIKEYIIKDENKKKINSAVSAYLDSTTNSTLFDLIQYSEVKRVGEEIYAFENLDSDFLRSLDKTKKIDKRNLSEKDLYDIAKFANVNYVINNIEYHKVFFGDPYQFKIKDGNLDETKRIKLYLSPRRKTFDSPEYNTWLMDNMNVAGNIELTKEDIGHHQFKSYAKTFTAKDVNIVGSVAMMNNVPDSIKESFAKTNEADAASWLMDNTFREIKLKNGQWSDEAEAWHQWQMAWTRQNHPNYTYKNSALEKQDRELVSKPAPSFVIEVIKPVVSGIKNKQNFINAVIDKYSQMPIYYSMVKGTNLENLYNKMMEEGYGYAILESGRKEGTEGLQALYNEDGSFNEESINNTIEVPWKAYGILVENAPKEEKHQTRGSQLTKMSSMDLFDKGIPSSPEAAQEYERNTAILKKMHENAYNELLKKLSIVDTGVDYVLENGKVVSEQLMYEMLRRNLSDNAKDTLEVDDAGEFLIPFEASPEYVKVRRILFSMIHKSLVSPKMNGGPHVQVPVTLFESAIKGRSLVMKTEKGWEKISKEKYNAFSEEDKKKVLLSSDTLKFYENEDGKRYCEVMLPAWFRKELNKNGRFKNDQELLDYLNNPNNEEGQSILRGVGFRIPTQSLSSAEVFKVKAFLPDYMGSTVVVPSEITTKAGSDFDIDKLNMYLKATYIDRTGNLRLIKYYGSEESTKQFYSQLFDSITEDKILRKRELQEAIDIYAHSLDDPNGLLKKYSSLIDSVIGEDEEENSYLLYDNSLAFSEKIEKEIEKLNDQNIKDQLRERFVDRMYKKSLENEYYDSLEKMLTLPENFVRLITPVDDAGLKDLSKKLDDLRGTSDDNIKGKLINRSYMSKLRHAFVVGKKWVGIAAVNITNLSLRQKGDIYIDPRKIKDLPKELKSYMKDVEIKLPHNTTTINGKTYTSLSGTTVKGTDQLISQRLSGYATAFVDVAKDPFILKIIKSEAIINTFMFMEAIGAGENGIMFLNQPIIQDYITMLDGLGSTYLYNSDNISAIKQKYAISAEEVIPTELNIKNFEKNIQDYAVRRNITSERNAEQQLIFSEFLKYSAMAQQLFDFTQATNYDTTKFGSSDTLTRKQMRTAYARKSNIISSVEEVLNKTFIGDLEELLSKSFNSMGAILKLEKEELKLVTNTILEKYAMDKYLSAKDFDKVANKIKLGLLDYIVQTKSGLNSRIKEILVDKSSSVASRLEKAKQEYPELKILRDLEIVSSSNAEGTKSIKLNVNIKEAYDENLYTGMMRELKEEDDFLRELYEDIVILSIYQGSYSSPISIRNIIPIEDFAKHISPIFKSSNLSTDLDAFLQGMFLRNNYKDNELVPEFTPHFKVMEQGGEEMEPTIDENFDEVYQYKSDQYPSIKSLEIKPSERKVLLLSEKFNRSYINNDLIKVKRITKIKDGSHIDLFTGKTVTDQKIRVMKAKGNPMLNQYIGYQKVYSEAYDDNNNKIPLTTMNDYAGKQYVYKIVNLYGEGMLGQEYYTEFIPSQTENNTFKVQEIDDSALIEYYYQEEESADVVEEEVEETVIVPEGKDILSMRQNPIAYTQGQEKALKDVEKLILSGKGNYLIAGYAGTGKTTIAENIVKFGKDQGKDALVIAPTNKAAKVLNEKLNSTGAGTTATTIHKAIYGEPDPVTGEWIRGANVKNSVIIVDESSMIDKELMKDLLESTKNKNNVVVFMGDGFQLEQIGEDSKLFKSLTDTNVIQKEYGVKLDGATQLTEVKRQALDSQILKVATLTRSDNSAYYPKESTQDFEVMSSRNEFVNSFRESIKNNEDVAMIVSTNNERLLMNKIARESKFGKDATNLLNPEESIAAIANSTDYSNSEIFKIKEINNIEDYGQLTFTSKDGKREVFDVSVANVLTEEEKIINLIFFPASTKPSIYHGEILKLAKEQNPDLYAFLDNYTFTTRKGVEKLSPELVIGTYGYAITGHKSQGSQWKKVYVTQSFNAPNWNPARWYYTAITRASDKAIVLPSSYNKPITNEEINSKLSGIVEETAAPVAQPSTQPIVPTPAEQPAVTQNRLIKVNQFNITLNADGTMYFDNGKEVTDQTIKNKVMIKKELQDGTLRISTFNNSKYFVLLDGTILGSGKTNLGKETIKDPSIANQIIEKAVLYKKQC